MISTCRHSHNYPSRWQLRKRFICARLAFRMVSLLSCAFFLCVWGPNLACYQLLMKMTVKISGLQYWYTTGDTDYTSFLSGNSSCKTQHYWAHTVTVVFPHVNHIARNYPYWTSTILLWFSHLIRGAGGGGIPLQLSGTAFHFYCLTYCSLASKFCQLTSFSFSSLFMDMWNSKCVGKGSCGSPLTTLYHCRTSHLVLHSYFSVFQVAIHRRTLSSCHGDSFDSIRAFSTGPLLNTFWKSKHNIYTWI